MEVNQVERAARAWPILVERARQRTLITYGDLGALIGVHPRALRYVLGVLQDYCMAEQLPPITILVVNKAGMLGDGFIAFDRDDLGSGRQQVYAKDWAALENPFAFSASGASYKSLVNDLVGDPDQSGEVYRLVKSRGVQQILFRDALMKAYQRACAFTGITFEPALEACHIVPWSEASPSARLDVRNGLLLNSLHHRLFDSGYMTVSTDYRLIYCDPKAKEGTYSSFDRLLSTELHGCPLRLPWAVKHRPNPDYLRQHHEQWKWTDSQLRMG